MFQVLTIIKVKNRTKEKKKRKTEDFIFQADKYLVQLSIRSFTKRCEICSNLEIKQHKAAVLLMSLNIFHTLL